MLLSSLSAGGLANASPGTLKRGEAQGGSMRPAHVGLALVLLAAGLAGCLDGGDADADEDLETTNREPANGSTANATAEGAQATVDEGPQVNVTWFNGSVRGRSAPMLGAFCVETCDNQFEFQAPENRTGLVVELAWEADASLLLDVDIPYDDCDASMGEDCPPEQTSGDSGHLVIRVTEASELVAGNWTTSAWAEDSLPEAVDFTIAVSQFDSAPPPGGYARLAPSS